MYNINLIKGNKFNIISQFLVGCPNMGRQPSKFGFFWIKIKFWFKDVLSMIGKWWGMMKHKKAHKEMIKH
jgi:hypothetical protein